MTKKGGATSWWNSGSRPAGRIGTRSPAPPPSSGRAAWSPIRPTRSTAWRPTRPAGPRWRNSIASRDGPSTWRFRSSRPASSRSNRRAACWGRPRAVWLQRFWPGPLTLVIPAWPGLDARVHAGLGTVAVRVPDHGVARMLARAVRLADHLDQRQQVRRGRDAGPRRGQGGARRRPRRAHRRRAVARRRSVDDCRRPRRRTAPDSAPEPCPGPAC